MAIHSVNTDSSPNIEISNATEACSTYWVILQGAIILLRHGKHRPHFSLMVCLIWYSITNSSAKLNSISIAYKIEILFCYEFNHPTLLCTSSKFAFLSFEWYYWNCIFYLLYSPKKVTHNILIYRQVQIIVAVTCVLYISYVIEYKE